MLLSRAGDAGNSAPLLADLIGLDGAQRYGTLDLPARVRRARTLAVLTDQMLGLAARQPVLVVLEDAHWIDPTTLEVMEHALDRIVDTPVLILLTSRPEQQPELAGRTHVTRLTLNRLGRGGAEAIVEHVCRDNAVQPKTMAAIIARSDGVPLFVEELTKAVLETGKTTIPASLHDSLLARLDRLPDIKEVAQTAAVIGREFAQDLLAAVSPVPEVTLSAALDQLVAAELIFRRGASPASYIFKHALVQQAAYESLLRARRRALHRRVIEALEAPA
jgi:predicted ATPase